MKKQTAIAVAFALGAAIGSAPLTAQAKSAWQKPAVQECDLAPAGDCNVEVACPPEMPFVSSGAGGMPAAEPADHAVAMTMNLPIAKDKWRVRWRNMSAAANAKVKVAVRIKCSDDAAEAGW